MELHLTKMQENFANSPFKKIKGVFYNQWHPKMEKAWSIWKNNFLSLVEIYSAPYFIKGSEKSYTWKTTPLTVFNPEFPTCICPWIPRYAEPIISPHVTKVLVAHSEKFTYSFITLGQDTSLASLRKKTQWQNPFHQKVKGNTCHDQQNSMGDLKLSILGQKPIYSAWETSVMYSYWLLSPRSDAQFCLLKCLYDVKNEHTELKPSASIGWDLPPSERVPFTLPNTWEKRNQYFSTTSS